MQETTLHFLSNLAPVVQIVVGIAALIIFWEPIAQRLGWKKSDPSKQESVPLWAQTLIMHFNHETTDGQKRLEEGMGDLQKTSNRSVQLLEEIKEYGIPCRDSKVK